ncbi:hypothetical protein OK016_09730 [Vibrio chagasii]|nr:hypothetical protein [Vibrio chagasii]
MALDYTYLNLIIEYRGLAKLKSAAEQAAEDDQCGNGSCSHSPSSAVTATGRLSSTESKSLRIFPIRNEGRHVRLTFVAQHGWKIQRSVTLD